MAVTAFCVCVFWSVLMVPLVAVNCKKEREGRKESSGGGRS